MDQVNVVNTPGYEKLIDGTDSEVTLFATASSTNTGNSASLFEQASSSSMATPTLLKDHDSKQHKKKKLFRDIVFTKKDNDRFDQLYVYDSPSDDVILSVRNKGRSKTDDVIDVVHNETNFSNNDDEI